MNSREGASARLRKGGPGTISVLIKVTGLACVFVAVASLGLICHPSVANAQDPTKLPEPEYASTVYWFDASNNKLVPLERQKLNAAFKVRALGYGGGKSTFEANGPKSAVRFTAAQKLEFVFQAPPPNVDPQTIVEIVAFTAKKDHRELTFMQSKGLLGMGGMKAEGDKANVPFQVAKYSESSIKISPAEALKPGEYGVRTPSAMVVFCFGVDPVGKQ